MKNTRILSRLKPLTALPALLMLLVIFGFSNQNGDTSGGLSQNTSLNIIKTYDTVFQKNWDDAEISAYAEKIEYPIRKIAHVSEYLILAVLVCLPLSVYRLRGKRLFLTAVLLCVCAAAGDEFHQSFIPGRSPAVRDVFIDSIGICLGSGLFTFLLHNCTKRLHPPKHPDAHK